jgi:hypothetical protein
MSGVDRDFYRPEFNANPSTEPLRGTEGLPTLNERFRLGPVKKGQDGMYSPVESEKNGPRYRDIYLGVDLKNRQVAILGANSLQDEVLLDTDYQPIAKPEIPGELLLITDNDVIFDTEVGSVRVTPESFGYCPALSTDSSIVRIPLINELSLMGA